jgi:acyl-CoA thioester hydrolase
VRIKISLPSHFFYSTNIPVRRSYINSKGHLSWASMFRVLEEANIQLWKSLDYHENISLITVDAGINFKRQSFLGQTLRVDIAASTFTDKSFDWIYKVTEADSGTEIARAKAGMLCYDYQKYKVVPIPKELRNKLSK